QKLFLPGEAIEVEIALLNNSGAPLTFRPEDGWLDFTVTSTLKPTGEGSPVTRLQPLAVNAQFTVKHTDAAKTVINITPGFDLRRPGLYRVAASMTYPGGQAPVTAEPLSFNIVPGYKLMEQEFGLPRVEGDAPPEVRKYALQQLTLTEPREMRLYVTVSDSSGETVFRQLKLGRMAGSDKPPTRLDRLSNLHVLHQAEGGRQFIRSVVSPRGDLLVRETYQALGARPGLVLGEDGVVSVKGGVLQARPDDILPAKLLPAPGEARSKP
ncbi:MAG: hypothetical protein ACKODH_10120, partial [Limisphaerales bacterium]